MRKAALILALFVVGACKATAPDTVNLTPAEKATAQGFVERRMEISLERQRVLNEYNTAVSILNQDEATLNYDLTKWCYATKKAHKLDMTVAYQIDEWTGEMKRVK